MAETPENELMNLEKRLEQDVLPGLGYEDIYLLGWDDSTDYFRATLERSGRERAELEERVEQLEHLREIAIDIEACLDSRVWPMQFIREAFRDAINRTAISELKKEQEGDG